MDEWPRVGEVLCSPVSSARFLVIDPGAAEHMPTIGGVPLVRGRPRRCSEAVDPVGHCDLRGGQRYVDVLRGLTLLCIWPGRGSLRYDGTALAEDADPGRLRLAG